VESKESKKYLEATFGLDWRHCYHKLKIMGPRLFILLTIFMMHGKTTGQVMDIPDDTALLDLHTLALSIIPHPVASTAENIKKVVSWTNANFK